MKRLLAKRFNRTTVVLLGCIGFLAGLGIAHKHVAVPFFAVGSLVVFGMIILWKYPRKLQTMAVVVLLGLALGSWRGTVYLQQLQPYQTLGMQKVTLTGTANVDAVYGKNSQLSFVLRDVTFVKPYVQKVPGSIKVQGFGATMVYRGDRLEVSGKLYPTRGASQASISYAQLKPLGGTFSFIDELRRKFAAGMQTALPEPVASFGLGLLVGQRNTLPADISQTLLMVGLTHIIAVSGYNLTILLDASKRLMGNRSKVLSTLLALGLIAGFLLLAGTSASIVRAAVISVLGLTAWYYGRTVRPLLLILLAAALTAYANPVYLWADISWYLSFLAFFGVLVVAPHVTKRLYKDKQPAMMIQIVIESLCAELLTVPLVLYIFGQVSLVGLVANMLVVALIPLGMLLSLVAGLAGMLAGNIAGWFAWPANVLLTYMLDIAQLLSRLPHIFLQNRYLSGVDMVACYSALLLLVFLLALREKRRNDWRAMYAAIKVRLNSATMLEK